MRQIIVVAPYLFFFEEKYFNEVGLLQEIKFLDLIQGYGQSKYI